MHALQKVKSLLNPQGYILVVHDLVDPPRITVQYQDQIAYAGQLFSDTGFENQRLADLAIDEVVQQGVFTAPDFQTFENEMRADSLTALLEWLEESWESAYLSPGTQDKIRELVELYGSDAEIVIHMLSRITRLEPIE